MIHRRSSREMDAVGGVLESVLTGLEMGARTREYLALIMWPDIVGEQVARITAVQSVRNGVLHVDVETAAWAQELQFYKPDMMAKINRYIGSDAVKDVHFRVRSTLRRPLSRTGKPSTPRKTKG
ncbi:MAG: DUF721 domain-containing protein, partial [Armatimonadota bacterium]|nr:DUF721 domain-containing protein [Armatimonadota bacterium]